MSGSCGIFNQRKELGHIIYKKKFLILILGCGKNFSMQQKPKETSCKSAIIDK